VRPSTVVEVQIPADRCPGIGDGIVGAKIDLLILDRPPEPFDKDVVAPRSFAVHAHGDAVVEQDPGEGDAGELASMVGVEDFGPAISAQGASVLVSYQITAAQWVLTVSDNGVGKGAAVSDTAKSGGAGTAIIEALVSQLGAQLGVTSTLKGTSVSIASATFASDLPQAA
jgi:hypothetical protein